jgi:UDP-N-acetylglucosamine 2-epimerase (non-hydrolysing)
MDGGFVLATIHRAENTDNARQLEGIIDGLSQLPYRVVLAAHPRLVARAAQFDIDLKRASLCLVEPLDYPRMLAAVRGARAVVTDSGGLQKEAFLLRTPCITIRTETEWTETVDLGWNVLSPDIATVSALLSRPVPEVTNEAPYGDGAAAERVIRALETHR